MPKRTPWSAGHLPASATERDIVAYLNLRFSDLEDYLGIIHRENSVGSIPGGYLSLTFSIQNAPATAVATGVADVMTFPFTGKVIFAQAFCQGGDATIDLEAGPGLVASLFSGGSKALSDGASTYWSSPSDFVDARVAETLRLSVVSIDAATPHRVIARLILKEVSQVDAA